MAVAIATATANTLPTFDYGRISTSEKPEIFMKGKGVLTVVVCLRFPKVRLFISSFRRRAVHSFVTRLWKLKLIYKRVQ